MKILNLPPWITDPDKDRINMHEPFERQYWLRAWGITDEQLELARHRAGSSIVRAVFLQVSLLSSGAADLRNDQEKIIS